MHFMLLYRLIQARERLLEKEFAGRQTDSLKEERFMNELRKVAGGSCVPVRWQSLSFVLKVPAHQVINPFQRYYNETLPAPMYILGNEKYVIINIQDVVPAECGCMYS